MLELQCFNISYWSITLFFFVSIFDFVLISLGFIDIIYLFCCSCREDYLKALKALFREIVRVLRFEINFVAFCRGLMQERNDSYFVELDQNIKVSG